MTSGTGGGALQQVTLPGGKVISYDYDALQRRIARRVNGAIDKRWVYDGQYRVVAEVDGNGSVTSRFVYGSQGHSPDDIVKGGVIYAYVKNHLGSIRAVVNAMTGAVAQQLDYDEWGVVVADSSPGFQPFGFAGGIYDLDTGLTHFGFRDYDATAGTWTSKDPIRLGGGENSYVYRGVTSMIDPSGRLPFLVMVPWRAPLALEEPFSPKELSDIITAIQTIECTSGYEAQGRDLRNLLDQGRIFKPGPGSFEGVTSSIYGSVADTTIGGTTTAKGIGVFDTSTDLTGTLIHELVHWYDKQAGNYEQWTDNVAGAPTLIAEEDFNVANHDFRRTKCICK